MERMLREAIRYLGYGKAQPDQATLSLIETSLQQLQMIARPKSTHLIYPCIWKEDGLQIGSIQTDSRNLKRNLEGCEQVVVIGFTLGIEVDQWIRRYMITDMAKATIFQACAAAYLEAYCDEVQEEIMQNELNPSYGFRPRFSPGYGDLDIRLQRDLLNMIDAQKKIGISMTESYMLIPTKSVTAFIGITKEKQNCHKHGCEACVKKDCIYRRD